MKVILLKDVPKLGKKDDIKEVNQGHALNFLIPRKLVVPATPNAVTQLEKRKKEHQVHKAVADELIAETMRAINGKTISLSVKTNEKGHLFKKVHEDEIVKAVLQDAAITIDASWIVLEHAIKEIGNHEVDLKHQTHKASFILDIKKED